MKTIIMHVKLENGVALLFLAVEKGLKATVLTDGPAAVFARIICFLLYIRVYMYICAALGGHPTMCSLSSNVDHL